MSKELIGWALPALMLIVALSSLYVRRLFSAVVLMGIFSLLSVGLFVSLEAADVALTEAVVGAGITLVLFLSSLALTGEGPPAPPILSEGISRRALPLCLACAALLAYGSLDMAGLQWADAPAHAYLTPLYLEGTRERIDVPNAVTAILASYRGYDTLGELAVIFTAGVGTLLLIGRGTRPAGG